jgi:hypothetical protein
MTTRRCSRTASAARTTRSLKQSLPAGVKLVVERQMQGVRRAHDRIKMLRDQLLRNA